MNATTLLKNDHAAVKKLFRQFSQTTTRARMRRQGLVERIAQELEIHATIEEESFYPALRQVEGTEELLEEAREEHESVKRIVGEVQGMDPDSEELDERMEELRREVLHHATEEEREIFPKARELGHGELGRIGLEMAERKKALKTGATRRMARAARRAIRKIA